MIIAHNPLVTCGYCGGEVPAADTGTIADVPYCAAKCFEWAQQHIGREDDEPSAHRRYGRVAGWLGDDDKD